MNSYDRVRIQQVNEKIEMKYPVWSIMAVLVLIYLTPFVSSVLAYLAFTVCLYRVIRYDARVFAVDYCILIPLTQVFRTSGGMSLLIWLALLAGIWYFIRGGIRADSSYVLLIVLLNYLITRMQFNISNFVLCFGQLFLLCVLLPKQDEYSAARTVKAFCLSLTVSSVYALLLRNTWQIRALRGNEVPAYWGSSFLRFQGLFSDPNYYMSLLIVGLALLIKLKDCGKIKNIPFLVMVFCLTGVGILTFSKTFFLTLILLAGSYILWQFRNKKYLRGILLVIAAILMAGVLLFTEFTPFSVVLTRLLSVNNISDLTTGRTDVFALYWHAITRNLGTFLFGSGFAAERLTKDPHNLYLEITYYAGAIGLLLIVCFYIAVMHGVRERTQGMPKQSWFAKYLVLLMVVVLYCSLHGMFAVISYAEFYLALLPMMMPKKKEEN